MAINHVCSYADDADPDCWGSCSVYNNPAKFGFRIVESSWEPDACYRFNAVILFEDLDTGLKWFASDSGCSCPRPFENVRGTSDMTPHKGHEQEYADRKYAVLHPQKWDDPEPEDW